MNRSKIPFVLLYACLFSISVFGADKFASAHNLFSSATEPRKTFRPFKDGYAFALVNIPAGSPWQDGKIKTGYGIGFEGTVFTMEGFGFLTHFSTAFHHADVVASHLKGTVLTFYAMPGAMYEYSIIDTRKEKMTVYGMAMAGIGICNPMGNLNTMGTSGSPSWGAGVGFSYNFIKIGIRYLYAGSKFEYTIYPNDYVNRLKCSFVQLNLGYTFDFFPKRQPR